MGVRKSNHGDAFGIGAAIQEGDYGICVHALFFWVLDACNEGCVMAILADLFDEPFHQGARSNALHIAGYQYTGHESRRQVVLMTFQEESPGSDRLRAWGFGLLPGWGQGRVPPSA